MSVSADGACPCGCVDARKRPLAFARCCGPYLADFAQRPSPDAEALMRSRYCAFVLEDADYLMATWHGSRRPPHLEFEAGTKWLGLEVREHRVIDDSHAEVEFVARSRHAGRAHRLHERSHFVREDGRWYYVDGETK